ncbi:peptidase domain-containing ABC transporter [Daejeonella sp.]|uniref:peptidase domain-containing ABC transporter n=1 Tax=Daejeonella sp. TaxID=2805397 RepID=UPI0025C3B579|nr:peptidase domain-containing ABC transporter [Daejeonella sp.]
MLKLSSIKKTFVLQQDQSDCGVACLLSLINYYKGTNSLEKLRELSGTTITGTTLLGLYQCANQVGFTAEAFEADMPNLKALNEPCILHVLMEGNLEHYIVCYGYEHDSATFIIGDPGKGLTQITELELDQIWQSKALLQLIPKDSFELKKQQHNAKWLWFKQLIKDDLNILTITMVLGVLATVLNLATAIFSQKLIDNILPSGNQQKLIISLVLLFLVLLIRVGLTFIRQHFLLLQSKDFNNRIVGSFFDALVHLPKSFFDSRKTGDMITRMNDTARIQENIAYISGYVFIDIIILFTSSFFLINYSLSIALITFAFIPIIVLVILSYTKPIKNHQKNLMMASALNESNYIDTINGIMVIKAQGEERFFTQKIKTVYANLQDKSFALGKLGNRFSITTDIISVVLSLVLITVASFMVLNKQLKVGEMMAIISLTSTLIPAVGRLSQINLQIQESKVAFDRMYDFTSISPEFEVESIVPFDFKSLEAKNISFRFAGRKPVLQDISFTLAKGEMIALLGESGCGKSTTMAILEKFYQPETGDILVNGKSLQSIYTPAWRSMVAVVPQEIKLFNGTLLENIAIGNLREDEVINIIHFCNQMGFDKYFEALPQGYFTLVGEEGINLSGGQKQLLALARALYRKPQVLLLDEATSAMDRNTEKFILNLLESLKNEMAILLITHKMQTAKISDRIYVIENGKITSNGSPNQLMESDNFFSQLVSDAVM